MTKQMKSFLDAVFARLEENVGVKLPGVDVSSYAFATLMVLAEHATGLGSLPDYHPLLTEARDIVNEEDDDEE